MQNFQTLLKIQFLPIKKSVKCNNVTIDGANNLEIFI